MSRYSQLYIKRGVRSSDSERARRRLRAVFDRLTPGASDVCDRIAREIVEFQGYDFPSYAASEHYDFEDFFDSAETRDVLDAITTIFNVFVDEYLPEIPREWICVVGMIFEEENLAYRIDDEGVVHPFVDEEFEVNRATALKALSEPRFGEARTEFEAAYRHLRNGSGKEALRMMFPAVEVVAKVLFPGSLSRLMPNEVDSHLRPRLEQGYAGNKPAIAAGRLLLEGMKDWIKAAQLYRHGQEQHEPAEPPEDFVVAHLSAGATYLRWMIELCSS